MNFAETLKRLVESEDFENQFLDLLSLLEYVGCRKIIKGVPFTEVTAEILTHIQEESLHALILKRLVRRPTLWSRSRFSEMGWRYFKRLDEMISREVTPSYAAVSWAIEQRALKVYPLYLEITQREDVRHTIATILAQEKKHAKLFEEARSHRWIEIETELWGEFVLDLDRVIGLNPGVTKSKKLFAESLNS